MDATPLPRGEQFAQSLIEAVIGLIKDRGHPDLEFSDDYQVSSARGISSPHPVLLLTSHLEAVDGTLLEVNANVVNAPRASASIRAALTKGESTETWLGVLEQWGRGFREVMRLEPANL